MSAEVHRDVAAFLLMASKRSEASLEEAKRLRAAGFTSPAFVWAVRAVEIFLKYFLVAPRHLSGAGIDAWNTAVEQADSEFQKRGRWKGVLKAAKEYWGEFDPLLTTDGEDAYDALWREHAVDFRNAIVHGLHQADAAQVDEVIAAAEQLILQLKLRMVVGGQHPMSAVFRSILEVAREAHLREQQGDS